MDSVDSYKDGPLITDTLPTSRDPIRRLGVCKTIDSLCPGDWSHFNEAQLFGSCQRDSKVVRVWVGTVISKTNVLCCQSITSIVINRTINLRQYVTYETWNSKHVIFSVGPVEIPWTREDPSSYDYSKTTLLLFRITERTVWRKEGKDQVV